MNEFLEVFIPMFKQFLPLFITLISLNITILLTRSILGDNCLSSSLADCCFDEDDEDDEDDIENGNYNCVWCGTQKLDFKHTCCPNCGGSRIVNKLDI